MSAFWSRCLMPGQAERFAQSQLTVAESRDLAARETKRQRRLERDALLSQRRHVRKGQRVAAHIARLLGEQR